MAQYREDNIGSLVDFPNQLSPYYNDDHRAYRLLVRQCNDELFEKYRKSGKKQPEKKRSIPNEFFKELASKYPHCYFFPFGYGEWTRDGRQIKWDPFYTIIFSYESKGVQGEMGSHIHYIAIPPLLHYGTHAIHKQVIQEVQSGDKLVSLAISELSGGSDVAQLKTTAVKDGKGNYIVNGNKYWITGGCRADYFVTMVRTGTQKDARFGLSLLLIPRTKGVFTSKLLMQGAEMNDTAAVTFNNVVVPEYYLIGKENEGFKPLMLNFNFERFMVVCDMVTSMRIAIEESIKWAKERKTFGKPLIKHQVIRHKIANMSRRCIACHSMLERIAYQLSSDTYGRNDKSIARNVALLKVQCSKTLQYIAIEASQIFGGRSYVRGGRGGVIDEIYRGARASAIAAGSEEVMLDLAMRQAKL
eukprot:CAMPEP_0197030846 /NCGR_PEP_ID=MMETSP1384-20130603/9990_1 /TAXON_ID=29189 /ORGANISM="Ammonia sp." /LENGTH=414 /DNA_ID=CAMNT_0042460271 /DNA_START=34 /DNA_END=1278 /DNA_ORIENTATION=+